MSGDVANPCADCGGGCCSFRTMQIAYIGLDRGQRYDSAMLEHEGIDNLIRDDGEQIDAKWFIVTKPSGERYIGFECAHLDDGMCSVYEDRPTMCKKFECLALSGEMTFEEFEEEHLLDDGIPDSFETEEVTERVREIVAKQTEEST